MLFSVVKVPAAKATVLTVLKAIVESGFGSRVHHNKVQFGVEGGEGGRRASDTGEKSPRAKVSPAELLGLCSVHASCSVVGVYRFASSRSTSEDHSIQWGSLIFYD